MSAQATYTALRIPSLETLHPSVRIDAASIREGVNEPDELTGTVHHSRVYERVLVESTGEYVPVIAEWGTLLIATTETEAWGFIVTNVEETELQQETLAVTGLGFSWVMSDVPWLIREFKGIEVDPLKVARMILEYVVGGTPTAAGQLGVTLDPSLAASTLNVTIDSTTSPARIGEEERDVEFTTGDGQEVEFTTGPYKLSAWDTLDLYDNFSKLSAETPFEWDEVLTYDRDSEAPPRFHIRLGYPALPTPEPADLYFELDFNVIEPQQPEEDEFFTDVYVVGGGEGSRKFRRSASRQNTKRHKRWKIISDQSLRSNKICQEIANAEVARADEDARFIETCRVLDHPAARPGTFRKGDIITLRGRTAWDADHVQRCKIVATERRMSDNSTTVTLARLDR